MDRMAHSKLLGIREKRNVSTGKTRLCLEYIIEKHDIVCILMPGMLYLQGLKQIKN